MEAFRPTNLFRKRSVGNCCSHYILGGERPITEMKGDGREQASFNESVSFFAERRENFRKHILSYFSFSILFPSFFLSLLFFWSFWSFFVFLI